MKKFRFALLALAVSAITFAFTPSPAKGPTATLYAFNMTGAYLGSGPSIAALKAAFCPGADQQNCALVYNAIDAQNQPVGAPIATIRKPQ